MVCSSCAHEIPPASRFCPSCGSEVDLKNSPTVSLNSPPERGAQIPPLGPLPSDGSPPNKSPRSGPPSSGFGYEARYVPGATLADRYRIVSPLGKGGMGEVYRAEDMKLGQTVALKFLPQSLAKNPEALSQFTREVRLTRQISHPNVCRVFDIGEIPGADGKVHTFLTMEFVDGEDLASLMRRIGRLPSDKALEIARQTCAGLAAAHEQEIIHRDLKPANVMLDGRGRVRITDFGLAGISAELQDDHERAGTPAYMSPEQFSGGDITPKSDLYSLGLVLYEIFTGKRPFTATTMNEMAQQREKSAITLPSAYVKEIDPLVERVIMRCLEKDPAKRPVSAIQVAAALPGGDPLAAAIAAGDTPSPEMVAAAGIEGGLAPWLASTVLGAIIILLGVNVFLSERSQLLNLLPAGKSPEILQEDSRKILQSIGYAEPPVDSGYWLEVATDYWVHSNALVSPGRYRGVAKEFPSPIRLEYRQSPGPLQTSYPFQVNADNPSATLPGDAIVSLDTQGRLTRLRVIPLVSSDPVPAAQSEATYDWRILFAASELNLNDFKPVAATWYPRDPMDQQFAWEGQHDGQAIRVQAGTYRGKPVFFQILESWRNEIPPVYNERLGAYRFVNRMNLTLASSLFCLAGFLAFRNIRMGRSDLRGGLRGSALLFIALLIWIVLNSHWAGDAAWGWGWWQLAVALPAGIGFQYAAFYLGLEPYFRRTWPELLISWSRAWAGDIRNPLVGRDVLMGVLIGTTAAGLFQFQEAAPYWFSIRSVTPAFRVDPNLAAFIGGLSAGIINPFLNAIGSLAVIFVMLKVTRRKSVAVFGVGAIWILFALQSENPWGLLPISIVIAVLMTTCMVQNGALGLVVAMYVEYAIRFQSLTWDLSRWYAPFSVITLLVVLAIALYGFYISAGGRRI
ncbi:MAG TPA: serine/threonine-protein kinase, partial [Candidatus Acidoferrales bacterium]